MILIYVNETANLSQSFKKQQQQKKNYTNSNYLQSFFQSKINISRE